MSLQVVRTGHKGSEEVARGYRGYKGLQRVTVGSKGF